MKEKIKIVCYECKKCNRTVYFRSNEEYTTRCKVCGNEMQIKYERSYNPKNGLSAIRNSNINYKNNNSNVTENVPTCPTCHSKNVKLISAVERGVSIIGFGIFSKKINKSFKCKNCGYTW